MLTWCSPRTVATSPSAPGRLERSKQRISVSVMGRLSLVRTWRVVAGSSVTTRRTPCSWESTRVMARMLSLASPRAPVTWARTPGLLTRKMLNWVSVRVSMGWFRCSSFSEYRCNANQKMQPQRRKERKEEGDSYEFLGSSNNHCWVPGRYSHIWRIAARRMGGAKFVIHLYGKSWRVRWREVYVVT